MSIFHLAIPTHNLEESKKFYVGSLDLSVGREYPNYVIFDFFGNQLVCHLAPDKVEATVEDMYPRHFGLIFPTNDKLEAVYKRAKDMGAKFYEDIFERHVNKPGWHKSFFLVDPSNNLVEFKYYYDSEKVLG